MILEVDAEIQRLERTMHDRMIRNLYADPSAALAGAKMLAASLTPAADEWINAFKKS